MTTPLGTPRFSEIRCRYFVVDGPTARRLREERGLSIEQLAIKAGCIDKTVQALEMGKPKLKSVVGKVAKGLGVAPEQLKPIPQLVTVPPTTPAPAGNAAPVSPRRLVIVFNLTPELLENAPEEIHFVLKLAEHAGTTGSIEVLDAEEGSIRLTLEMSEEDAVRVFNAFKAGKLKELGIRSISELDKPGPLLSVEALATVARMNISSLAAIGRQQKALELKQRWRAAQAAGLRPDLPQRCRLVLVYQVSLVVLESAPAELPFVVKLSEDVGTTDPVVVLRAETGSSRLTLDVSHEDALRIVDAFREGNLGAHGLRSVTLFDTQDAVEAVSPYPGDTWDFSFAQTDNEMVVKAQLPGQRVNRIALALSGDDALTIEATVGLKGDDAGQLGISGYQWYGRTAVLPCDLDKENGPFQKQYANGFLELHIPTVEPPAEDEVAILRHRMVEVQMPDIPTTTGPED